MSTIIGDGGNNSLPGTIGDDDISGLGGNDTLDGDTGNDTIDGGSGNDSLVGGIGIDTASFGSDSAGVSANLGTNTSTGSLSGSDTLSGFENLSGGNGNDTLAGNGNANTLLGLGGNDSLVGGAGNDSLDGGEGNDTIGGGGGNGAGDDTLSGGNGTDQANYGNDTLGVTVNLGTGTATGGSAGNDVLNGIENVIGGSSSDTLTGDANGNLLTGNNGNDVLDGGDGNDILTGGAGNDTLIGGNGIDAANYNTDTLPGGLSADLSTGLVSGDSLVGNDSLSGIENLNGGSGADTLTGDGNANNLAGNLGNDVIDGGNGDDTLTGGPGHDSIIGGGGNDSLVGGSDGDDTLTGGTGNDTLNGGTGIGITGDKALAGGQGNDSLDGGDSDGTRIADYRSDPGAVTVDLLAGNATDGWGDHDTLAHIDAVAGSIYNDTILGGAGDETLVGLAGADSIDGGGGLNTLYYGLDSSGVIVDLAAGIATDGFGDTDHLVNIQNVIGSTFDDSIAGDSGNNSLQGSDDDEVSGNDTLNGGAGNDTLIGSTGSDVYVYASGGGADVVADFAHSDGDQIDLTGIVGLHTLTAVLAHTTQNGTDSVLDFGGGNILTLQNVNQASLVAGDFIITANATPTDISLSQNSIPENSANATVVGALSATDPNLGDTLSFSLVDDAGGLFAIDGSNLVLAGAVDYELATSHSVTVRVSDGDGGYYDEAFSIDVGDANDNAPIFDSGSAASTPENISPSTVVYDAAAHDNDGTAANNTLVYSLSSGGDNNLFSVDGATGEIRFLAPPDFEIPADAGGNNVYDIVVHANDGVHDTTQAVAITVTDVFEGIGGTAGNDTLIGTSSADNISGLGGTDSLVGNAGDDTLNGGTGADTMAGGQGNDTYSVDAALDVVTEAGAAGTDTVLTTLNTYTLGSNVEVLTFTGAGDFAGTGNTLANLLTGGTGNDTLSGGTGADTMTGGIGDDIYVVDNAGDAVTEVSGEGTDTIKTALSAYTLAPGNNVEKLVYTGAANFTGTGNELDNALTGGTGNDQLSGGVGADTMTGGIGNDIYTVDSLGDSVVENSGEGTDTIKTSLAAYALGADLENLTFIGVGNFDGTGNGGNNSILGGTGNDTLNGGTGADTMAGGQGSDTYSVDTALDVVTEAGAAGTDTVLTALNAYTLGSNVEVLTFTGAGDFAGTGNTLANALTGGTGNDTLSGGTGADTMTGGTGNDIYVVDNALDVVTENLDEGTDTIKTALSAYTLAPGNNVEKLVYTGVANFTGTGNELDNAITGGTGNDQLSGGVGADTMTGGIGNDIYTVDSLGDSVVENSGEGTDTIKTSLAAYTLGNELENLTFIGVGNFDGTGNGANNSILGGTGNDTLNGGTGADTMAGGQGNDTYSVDTALDVVTEAGAAGTDTVLTALNAYTLGSNVEVLTFTGAGDFAGTGNTLANALTGGTGNDTLSGGTGADTMTGGTGDDIYVVDNAADLIVEISGDGTDAAQSSVTYNLSANVETLTLTGAAAINGTGNVDANTITGNGANNVLAGLGGADMLDGTGGIDTASYAASASAVNVSLASGLNSGGDAQGDSLLSIENVTGSGLSDTLEGDGGNNVLIGGAGIDTVSYEHASGAVTVSLALTTAQNSLGAGTDTLSLFENLTGSDFNDSLTGSSAANILAGLDGNDTLSGGAGADTMAGGMGDDTFIVDNVADIVSENSAEGIDTVQSAVTFALSANVDNLLLTGTGAVNGTGNNDANALTGNGKNNVLTGLDGSDTINGAAGNDTLDGGAGADSLTGGAGNDSFVFHKGEAAGDILSGFDGPGAAAGDKLDFFGYGAGSTVTHVGDLYTIHDGVDLSTETIQVVGVTTLTIADYLFH